MPLGLWLIGENFMTMISVSLFVSRGESRNGGLLNSVMRACDRHLDEGFELTVVDIDDDPQLAVNRGLMATPALELQTPGRTHLLVGDLGHEPRLAEQLEGLELR